MKNIFLTVTYLVGIGELILAGYFWATNQKNEIRRVMALLAFATGMWVVLSASIAYRAESPTSLFIDDLVYSFGALLITAFVHFSIIYPHPQINFDALHAFLLYIPAVLFSTIALTTRTIVARHFGSDTDPGQIIGGPVYPIYNFYFSVMYVIGLIILIRKIPYVDGFVKHNLKLVVLAFMLGGLPALYLDLVTPLFNLQNPNYLIGNIATIIWLGTVTHIITRKE